MSKLVDFLPNSGSCDLLIIAGEASADEHAARLVRDLLKTRPDMKISALGGDELRSAGAQLVFPLARYAVVGFIEVIKNYGTFRKIFKHTIDWIAKFRPRCILLVDYPGFNLRLARALKKHGLSSKGSGDSMVLQYVSPQLWAWKPKRRFEMAKTLNALGVIFPFEEECYDDVDLPVSFVGHPFAHPSYQSNIRYDESGGLLLLPGSRLQPVSRILPAFLDAFEILAKERKSLQGLLPVSGNAIRSLVEKQIKERKLICDRIKIVDRSAELSARAALMSSGTMSLSCAWAGVPGVIGYRAHPITYLIGKLLVGVPYLGMANLLLPDNPPNPEFLQGRANGKILAQEMSKILDNQNSGEDAKQTAGKLFELLARPQNRATAEWLIQEGRLG